MPSSPRRFAPSFVITISALAVACNKPQNEAIEPVADPVKKADAGKVEVPPDDPPPKPKLATKKRVRTSKSPPKYTPASGIVPFGDLAPQNPTDSEGRLVYVSGDDSCYVQGPMKNKPKVMVPGMPWFDPIAVDCPSELDDPAWDDCVAGTLEAPKGKGDCYCMQPGGNPPPPPNVVACPKHKK